MKVATLTEPSSEAFGSRTTFTAMAPSSSGGMNSVPMKGRRASEATRAPPERPSVTAGRRTA